MPAQEIKLDGTDVVALDQCDATRRVTSFTMSLESLAAQVTRAQANLDAAKASFRAVEVGVCANHGVTVLPGQSIVRVTRPDGQYLVVSG